jgi:hypothetical protein
MNMHKCKNNTEGDISHIEQLVNSFLPYSQEKLGFDKPVKIVFQSDPSNADVLLGKTAHYDPQQFEVYLYTDKRHPKDVMRSLSHELVHHAQNCRGDFGNCGDTDPGYAQRDPQLRKMEREAYTKGNLIFRDFEDLIKAGKITVDINFKDSGEPQMSLKEWRDNELNTLLMKKWGLLSEGTAKEHADEEGDRPSMAKDMDIAAKHGHKGKTCAEAHPGEDEPVKEAAVDVARSRGQLHKTIEPEADEWPVAEPPGVPGAAHEFAAGGAETRHLGDDPDTYVGPALGHGMAGKKPWAGPAGTGAEFYMPNKPEKAPPGVGQRISDPRHLQRTTTKVPAVNVREGRSQKISVREAKEITRRIMERVRKEGR